MNRIIICEILIALFLVFSANTVAQLRVGYYQSSCALAELIVKEEVLVAFLRENGVAPGLLRLHFHDCFVRGCDASVLIESTSPNQAEKDATPNESLRPSSFQVINTAKARIEAICKGVVSCADIVAFAARDSMQLSGGIAYDVPAGRKDGRVSLADEASADLPSPLSDVNQLTQAFAKKGFTQEEMVTLSGTHTLGQSHCTSINRIYNFGTTTLHIDPTLDPTYAAQLMDQCPEGDDTRVIPMDPLSPTLLDSSGYYRAILANRSLFTSDQTLISTPETKALVIENAQNQFLWAQKLAAAMVKMGKIDVMTGNMGEIRSNCSVINS